eukprot:5379098-Pleurochrysis_carterae.AAC.1
MLARLRNVVPGTPRRRYAPTPVLFVRRVRAARHKGPERSERGVDHQACVATPVGLSRNYFFRPCKNRRAPLPREYCAPLRV